MTAILSCQKIASGLGITSGGSMDAAARPASDEARSVAVALRPADVQASMPPLAIVLEQPRDEAAREALLDRTFGPARFRKTCERLRAGRLPARGLVLVARTASGELVGTVRLWHVDAGGVPALMLGPLAVDARFRCSGLGARLMAEALERARALGHGAVLLVGDAPYYARFGFERRHTLGLSMPGPVEDGRFLGRELVPGAFAKARGLVKATGAFDLAARRRSHRTKPRRVAA